MSRNGLEEEDGERKTTTEKLGLPISGKAKMSQKRGYREKRWALSRITWPSLPVTEDENYRGDLGNDSLALAGE
jgi:hypothetical protein